jgi:hypothetical protein
MVDHPHWRYPEDMSQIHEQLGMAAQEAARLARGVHAAQLSAPTPCPDYDVRALAAHLMQDIVLHSWDLAAATGQKPRFPDDVTGTVLHSLEHGENTGSGAGWYQKPVPTGSSSLLDQAVARSGRDPNWQTTSANADT